MIKLAFVYDISGGQAPYPIVSPLESTSYWCQDELLKKTASVKKLDPANLRIGCACSECAHKLLGNTDVPSGDVIDLANLAWNPKTGEITMAYKKAPGEIVP